MTRDRSTPIDLNVGTAAPGCPGERSSPVACGFSGLALAVAILVASLATSCSRTVGVSVIVPKPTAFGAAIVESSGGKQIAQAGTTLPQPLVVQVNDQQGTPVPGALVQFSAAPGVTFDPVNGLTDSSGQVTTNVTLAGVAGRYQLTASATDKTQKKIVLKVEEIALGYQQTLGRQINDQYCDRCHNPESTVERVSNFDNLEIKPHPFTEGDTLNKMSDADLTAIISHGGPALSKSALMPAWGNTLSKSDIQALVSYIRAVSDPHNPSVGPIYAKN
jgi:mono/diheme cytochrome c family protein